VWRTCPNFCKQIPQLTIDPENPEDIITKHVEDHLYDPARYTLMIKRPKKRDKKKVAPRWNAAPADPLDVIPPLMKGL
jgi:hypothetical protein